MTLQAVYEGVAWVGLGFSESGGMLGSDAVIGLPHEGTALEYYLASYVSNVGVWEAPGKTYCRSCCTVSSCKRHAPQTWYIERFLLDLKFASTFNSSDRYICYRDLLPCRRVTCCCCIMVRKRYVVRPLRTRNTTTRTPPLPTIRSTSRPPPFLPTSPLQIL